MRVQLQPVGHITLTLDGGQSIQLTYPYVTIDGGQLFISLDTAIRIGWPCFGFTVLGFGLGILWLRTPSASPEEDSDE